MVARPLEFLSSVKWRPPPLEVQRECQDFLPNEAREQTLLRMKNKNRGSFSVVPGPTLFLSSADG